MARPRKLPALTPTVLEEEHGITATDPVGDLHQAAVAPVALNGWSAIQVAVGTTLVERLRQSQRHRSAAWGHLGRA